MNDMRRMDTMRKFTSTEITFPSWFVLLVTSSWLAAAETFYQVKPVSAEIPQFRTEPFAVPNRMVL